MATGGEINTDILSDEIFDVLCSMCKNRGKKSEGEKFCVDCHDYFCMNCVIVHSQVPVLACHKVLDKSQVKSGTSKGLPRAPVERSCKDIFFIPEFIQNNSYQVSPREIQTKLKVLAKTLTIQSNKFQQDKQSLLKRKAELLDDIRKFRQEINDQLDKLEKSSVDEIEYKFKLLEGNIEEGLKQLQAHKAKVTSANDNLTSSNPNQAELFVYVKMGEDAEKVANKFIEATKVKITVSYIEFRPDRDILQQLKQIQTIGMLIEEKAGKLQIAGRQSYCVKVKSEEIDCRITSACYMEDGTIVLADVANNKLKRLDSHNYIITDCYSLPEEPHQIYKTSVFICSMSGRKLKQFIIDPDGGMYSLTNSLVAVSKDGTRIYHVKRDRLEVLDNNGQIVTTFSGKLLTCASYCHVTEAGSVLVSGQFSNNVLQFTSDGELIGEVIKADCDNLNLKPQSVCCNHQMSKMCIVREDNNIEVYDI
ncbi:uncharacterized protein LOC132728497 [Ruditapes philippinarum]|uniref:uncharacterized protein LOC132728497 n=1 Tax=Ruditapes philippinarum TaxID=129788 RepID=UPI00295B533E|nr:uncharacterized protein LOC132728497 [Ruditapes philippinarum]